jgi:hypothetical protein
MAIDVEIYTTTKDNNLDTLKQKIMPYVTALTRKYELRNNASHLIVIDNYNLVQGHKSRCRGSRVD